MRINSINSTTPKFKSVREDRNTTSQLSKNNDYSLTEPNQRRINKAIENLAKQRGEENIKFLLNVGENLTYQTNIPDAKPTKNEWRSKLKDATEKSLAISDPILKSKYESEISRVFDEPKKLSDDEKSILEHKKSIMSRVDLDSIKSNPNENIRNLEKNMDYFISSTETPIKQKAYVMERLDYMMSPDYHINPQLKDKKTQVLAEMMNDMVINTPESKVPNMKAVNQKTHGMCAAISIARKAVAYEDKPDYVDTLMSELDDTNKVMVYDRHNIGSGKRVPVEKTAVDFDYAQDKGYRIIDASTLQWMGIAGMYGNKSEKLHDFFAFDKNNFDAFHDSFFMKTINKDDLKTKHCYFQSLTKAKDEIGSVKADKTLKNMEVKSRNHNNEESIKLIQKYNDDTMKNIKEIVPDISKEELREDINNLAKLYAPSSEKLEKHSEDIKGYSFIPNEEKTQKEKKVKAYFVDKYAERISDKDSKDNISNLVSNIETVHSLENSLSTSKPLSSKIGQARKLYNAESAYRASIATGLRDDDILTDYLIHYNIPDRQTRISDGYQTVIDRITKKDDKKLLNHYTTVFGLEPDDKEGAIESLKAVKKSVDTIQTAGIDDLYTRMGIGTRKYLLMSEINSVKTLVEDGDKAELKRISSTMGMKPDKKAVTKELSKMEDSLLKSSDEKVYKHVFNKMGYKDEVINFVDVYGMFVAKLNDQDDPMSAAAYLQSFKNTNGLAEDASPEELTNAINSIGQTFNIYSQTLENAEMLLNVANDDGTAYFTVDGPQVVMKKMENEGKLVPAKDMRMLQTRFNKIDKIRSSDEFSSRQGKISDPSLYKLSNSEKAAVKQINGKINMMYSDTVKEYENMFKTIREPLEKHIRYIGTNEGTYWVGSDGHSGLSSSQEVKIIEQMTDKPYQAVSNIEGAIEQIKNTEHSGVSSTSVFNDKHGWHAQYIADVNEVGKDGRTAMFHDNTWGASEHENTWVDSEGLTRTDYSDNRGGEFGYITNDDWRNGNYVDNLTRKAGHITPHDIDNKMYKKLRPAGEEYDFSTISDIIVPGESNTYKDIAASIKDTIFVPDSVFLPTLKKEASQMTTREIQKAIFKNDSAGLGYHAKFDKMDKRIKGDSLHDGIKTLEDYNKLSDNDPIKITFEKAAIKLAYSDASMYKELGKATTMKEVQKVKQEQRKEAIKNFDYSFGKSEETLTYLAKEHRTDIANIVVNALKNNNIDANKGIDIVKNVVVFENEDEKAKFTGSVKDTVKFVLDKTSKQFDAAVDDSEDSRKAKAEIMTNMKAMLEDSLYFNKEDLNAKGSKIRGIRNWIDTKFNPKSDEEFVQIYRNLQDMPAKDFEKVRADVTDKQLGMSEQTGFDVLQKYNAANDEAESTVKNILFYEEYTKDLQESKLKTTYKYNKLERKTRGAVYVGERTFDDLYRSMKFTLSSVTYEKMFNKYKDRNIKKYGAFPAYPKLDMSNNKGIQSQVDLLNDKVNSLMTDIIQKKNIKRDYEISDEMKNYVSQMNPEKKPTATERKYMQKLAGEFITLNMNDESIPASTEAAYNLLDMDRDTTYADLKSNADVIINEFEAIKKANASVDLDEYTKNLSKALDNYTNTIIDVGIPPKYQRKLKEDAKIWQTLEFKLATDSGKQSNDLQQLKSKIKAGSINYGSEKQLNSFEKIQDMVIKTSKLNKSDAKKVDESGYKPLDIAMSKKDADLKKARVAEKQAEISEAIDRYVNKYIKEDSRDNVKANMADWANKEIRGGNRRKVTEDEVVEAREKFADDFYKYHLTNNPIELLDRYLLLTAKDAKEKYPNSASNAVSYERVLSDELSLTRYVEIQDALMEAVHEGNPAHVKHYFDDYTIDADNKVSMNSDEAISHMVVSLLMEDNTKPAKMFVEKLGLGDRVMDIETKVLHDAKPKKQVDKLAKTLRSIGQFQSTANSEFEELMNRITDSDNPDAEIETMKQNILKNLRGMPKNSKVVKAYFAAMDDAKAGIKDNPDMPRTTILAGINSTVLKEIQDYVNEDLEEKQDGLSEIHKLYKFLLQLRLPEYSKGYKLQRALEAEYKDLLEYNNNLLNTVSAENESVVMTNKKANMN